MNITISVSYYMPLSFGWFFIQHHCATLIDTLGISKGKSNTQEQEAAQRKSWMWLLAKVRSNRTHEKRSWPRFTGFTLHGEAALQKYLNFPWYSCPCSWLSPHSKMFLVHWGSCQLIANSIPLFIFLYAKDGCPGGNEDTKFATHEKESKL